MKILFLLSFTLLLILLLYFVPSPKPRQLEFEEGNVEIYFCPEDDCEKKLFAFLNNSKNEILCAFYDIDLLPIIGLLSEKGKNIEVKALVDHRNFEDVENGSFAISVKRRGLMHNKFCVVDGKKVFTGSFNPTDRGTNYNNNNMVIINSLSIANNYRNIFFMILNQTKYENKKIVIITNATIKNYFCPQDGCTRKVVKELSLAKRSIYFMAFSFTSREIANQLLIKHYENVTVKGIYEKTKISKYSTYDLLRFHDVNVSLDKNKYNMHHKVFIIDNKTVITGSFNPSQNANKRNDENIVVIDNRDIAEKYTSEFTKLKSKT